MSRRSLVYSQVGHQLPNRRMMRDGRRQACWSLHPAIVVAPAGQPPRAGRSWLLVPRRAWGASRSGPDIGSGWLPAGHHAGVHCPVVRETGRPGLVTVSPISSGCPGCRCCLASHGCRDSNPDWRFWRPLSCRLNDIRSLFSCVERGRSRNVKSRPAHEVRGGSLASIPDLTVLGLSVRVAPRRRCARTRAETRASGHRRARTPRPWSAWAAATSGYRDSSTSFVLHFGPSFTWTAFQDITSIVEGEGGWGAGLPHGVSHRLGGRPSGKDRTR